MRKHLLLAALVAALILPGVAMAADYETSKFNDFWTLATTWGGAGVPAGAADTGTVNDGNNYDQAVWMLTDLGSAGDWPLITVVTGGSVAAYNNVYPAGGTTIANPLTFDGGRLTTGSWWAPGGTLTGTITLAAGGMISDAGRDGMVTVNGQVTGVGGITVNVTDNNMGFNGLFLNNATNDFQGAVTVTRGALRLGSHALPAGKAVAVGAGGSVVIDVSQDYTAEAVPVLNIDGGFLKMGTWDPYNNVSVPFTINVLAGGATANAHGASWATNRTLTGAINLTGQLSVGTVRGGGDNWVISGLVAGTGTLRVYNADSYEGGRGWVQLDGTTENSYSGGTIVESFGWLRVTADEALGTGRVDVNNNGVLSMDVDQTYAVQPIISVNPGGSFYVNTTGALNLGVTLNGGKLIGGRNAAQTNSISQVTLTADSYLGGANGELTIGLVTGPYKLINTPAGGTIKMGNPASNYSGGTDVLGGTLAVTAGGALGTGTVAIGSSRDATGGIGGGALVTADNDGALDKAGQRIEVRTSGLLSLATTELASVNKPVVVVSPGGALKSTGGTVFTWGTNITGAPGMILHKDLAISRSDVDALPGTSGSNWGVYRGSDVNETVSDLNFGQDVGGVNVYRGLAAMRGATLTTGGTLTDGSTGQAQGIALYAQAGGVLDMAADTTFAATKLNLGGEGRINLRANTAGLPAAVSYDGNGAGRLVASGSGVLAGTTTLNAANGIVSADNDNSFDGTLNINSEAILNANRPFSNASITVNGGVVMNDRAALTGTASGWTFNAGAEVAVFGWESNPAITSLPGGGIVNYQFQVNDDYWYAGSRYITVTDGVVLNDNTRITNMTRYDGTGIVGYNYGPLGFSLTGGDITTSGQQGRIAAATNGMIEIASKVNFTNDKLIVGDTNTFRAISNHETGGIRGYMDLGQAGIVTLMNAANDIDTVDVRAGTLRIATNVARLGGAREVNINNNATLQFNFNNPTVATTLTGNGSIVTGGTLTLTPTATKAAAISPGASSGVLSVTGNLAFGSLEPNPVALTNANASDGFYTAGNWFVSGAIDGNPTLTAWCSYIQAAPLKAAFQTVTDQTLADGMTVKLYFDGNQPLHDMQQFRIAVTTADRSTYCTVLGNEQLQTEAGNVGVDGIWQILTPLSASSVGGNTLTWDGTGVISATGPLVDRDTYYVKFGAGTLPANITGVRIDQAAPAGTANYFNLADFKVFQGSPVYGKYYADVTGDNGVAGTDHDQVVVTGRATVNSGEVVVVPAVPSGDLRPTTPNWSEPGTPTGFVTRSLADMTILTATTGVTGQFASIIVDANPKLAGVQTTGPWVLKSGAAMLDYSSGNSVVLKGADIVWMALPGDANLDNAADVSDLSLLAGNFRKTTGQTWSQGDFNFDGAVDVSDLSLLAGRFRQTNPFFPAEGGAPVPEPMTMVLLGLGGLAVLARRRR